MQQQDMCHPAHTDSLSGALALVLLQGDCGPKFCGCKLGCCRGSLQPNDNNKNVQLSLAFTHRCISCTALSCRCSTQSIAETALSAELQRGRTGIVNTHKQLVMLVIFTNQRVAPTIISA